MNIQVREIADRDKPHCFELYSASNDVIKACKTNSEGKVVEGTWWFIWNVTLLIQAHLDI